MRLAIINLTGGGFSGGYKKYLINMLPRIASHRDIEAVLCVSPGDVDISSWFGILPNVEFASCSPLQFRHMLHNPDTRMIACLTEFAPDCIYFPLERFIKFGAIPVVNMVRNMEPFVPNMKEDTLRERVKKSVQRKLTRDSLRRANHTIAVSDYVKEHITRQLHIPDDKVTRVYHGHEIPTPGTGSRPFSIPGEWKKEFLFTCGSIRPARGLEDIFVALSILKKMNVDLRLVIAGDTVPAMRNYRAGLERFLASEGLTERVCWTGRLNDDEMRWCYEHCGNFVMTSRVEACPNIAVEAMSHGTITIAADNPPLPEFFENGAQYYKAGDGQSLAEGILRCSLLSTNERSILSERLRERSAMFSWESTADKTIVVLLKTTEQGNPGAITQA